MQDVLILFRSWVINKSVKNERVETWPFLKFWQITQDLNKILKNPTHPFAHIGAKFQQKLLNCKLVGARQNFQIFRQNTWFLENNRALPKFLYRILHYLISIIKL